MNIQNKISRLLTAIRINNIDIKIDTIQLYSETTERYFNVYKVYIKEWCTNIKGEYVYKYMLQDEFVSKIELLKYLIEKYKSIKEGEANG